MTVLKGSFLNSKTLAIAITKNEVLKNFFYWNPQDITQRNVYSGAFGDNIDNLQSHQIKENINLWLGLGNKNVRYKTTSGRCEEYDLQEINNTSAKVDLMIFAYNPLDVINNEQYTAQHSDDIKTRLDYFNFARFFFEKEFGLTDGEYIEDYYNDNPLIRVKYNFILNFNDIMQYLNIEDTEFKLDKITAI